MKSKKRNYETPKLTVYGGVEEITQAALEWGNGDYLATGYLAPCSDPNTQNCYPGPGGS